MACNIHDESVSSAATCAYETKPQQSGIDIEATTLEMEAFRGPRKMNGSVSVTQKDEIGMICMTWKDVWVTASNRKNGSKSILQGLTGYAKPGQLLAIMGPSGCGKSTLLDTLAGRLGSNTRQTGEILINGHKQALSYGTSAYVTQDDTLLTTLTVREAVHYSAQLQLPDTMSKEEKKERADFTIREMGLQDAINTRIGGWGCKGISGGQERRVSICIEILTRPKLLFLDEPTSGLDSAASYYVMRRIATLAQNDHIQRTVIVSIHQPSSEVFQLFNSLCLLSLGKTVYFGPASAATEFFASNGFPCPPLMNPSDHLLKTINKDFDQDIEVGLAGTKSMPTEEVIHILLNSYKSSERNQEVQNEVAVLSKKDTSSLDMKRGNAGFLNQCLVLTKRSFINMYRDLGYYWLRLVIYIALAITLATVFYDLGTSYDSIKDRGSLVAFINGFITFMTIGGFPSFVEVMKNLYCLSISPSVRDAKVVTDPNTARSKGYGFVKFSDENERNRAMTEMNGVYCSTRPMRISAATPKKTTGAYGAPAAPVPKPVYPVPAYTSPVVQVQPPDYDVNNTTIFVGNLDLNVSEEELKQNSLQFGEIVSVKIQPGKGFGFVQFGTRDMTLASL
ncbi:ABC transporter G family member 1 isoform X3 [Glycine max]|uniref:ABC transporter G family member 1 isoform X3 n=1 Tax=Glycine max TaxID=3847 RepID=UPI000295440E|nr:ABC transporter G family member 1 isoform X3 [Glycine max]XP_040864581.1 ABC transporter G family member 1 isoform X3 [Glycine max]XP_040864582.1 ABC transporter G family member 1 isoform X3 [Glycine max]